MAGIFCLLLSVSCTKDEVMPNQKEFPEYMMFGLYFSELNCFGNETCVEIFKVQSGKLLEDVSEVRPTPGQAYAGDFLNTLSKSDYDGVLSAIGEVPTTLLNMESGMYQTDSDGFASFMFCEYKSPGKHGYWIFNTAEFSTLPTDVQEFLTRLQIAQNIASF